MSDSNRVGLAIKKETAWGETPNSPTMLEMPYTSEGLIAEQTEVESETIRKDRMLDETAIVAVSAGGPVSMELAFGDVTTMLLEGALCEDVVTISQTGAFSVDSAAKQVKRTVGSFVTDGFKVGQHVRLGTGFAAANKGVHEIAAVAALALTLAPVPGVALADEAEGAGKELDVNCLRNGVKKPSFLIEKQFEDAADEAGEFSQFTGLGVDQFNLSFKSAEKVTCEVTFRGKQMLISDDNTSVGDTTATPANPILTASANVSDIMLDGAAMPVAVDQLTLSIANGVQDRKQVGSLAAAKLGRGKFRPTGTLTVFFEDFTLYKKTLEHTPVKLQWRIKDALGNMLVFTMRKVYLSKGDPTSSGGDNEVMQQFDIKAVKDSVTSCALQIDIFEAAA